MASSPGTVAMSTHSTSSADTTMRHLERIELVVDRLALTKKMLKEETKRFIEGQKKWDKVLEDMEQRIDAHTQQWTDLVERQRDNPYFQQLVELQKSLPKEEKEVKRDCPKPEDLKKWMASLGYKMKRTAELCEEGKTIQGQSERENWQLNKALRDMTMLETKHKEMLKKWTVEESLSEGEAMERVMKAVAKLKGRKGLELAEDLKKFLETSAGTSGAGQQVRGKPTSHTVYVPSSTGAGASTSGFQYKH